MPTEFYCEGYLLRKCTFSDLVKSFHYLRKNEPKAVGNAVCNLFKAFTKSKGYVIVNTGAAPVLFLSLKKHNVVRVYVLRKYFEFDKCMSLLCDFYLGSKGNEFIIVRNNDTDFRLQLREFGFRFAVNNGFYISSYTYFKRR